MGIIFTLLHSKAVNNVSRNNLIDTLIKYGVDKESVRCIEN